jgi:hypothetical protein
LFGRPGGYHDICVADKSNENFPSSAVIGGGYQEPTDYLNGQYNANTYLSGADKQF